MSTEFGSVEEAKGVIASVFGVEPSTFEEVADGPKVAGVEAWLLDDPETPEDQKKRIRDRIEAQKSFKFKTPKGTEVQIAIGPFRDGFCCYIIGDNGLGFRF